MINDKLKSASFSCFACVYLSLCACPHSFSFRYTNTKRAQPRLSSVCTSKTHPQTTICCPSTSNYLFSHTYMHGHRTQTFTTSARSLRLARSRAGRWRKASPSLHACPLTTAAATSRRSRRTQSSSRLATFAKCASLVCLRACSLSVQFLANPFFFFCFPPSGWRGPFPSCRAVIECGPSPYLCWRTYCWRTYSHHSETNRSRGLCILLRFQTGVVRRRKPAARQCLLRT